MYCPRNMLWPASRFARTDNTVFKLFYRCTVWILVVFSFVITCRLVFGYSFSCMTQDGTDITANVYCYTHPTFISVSALSKSVGHEIPYPGIDKYKGDKESKLVYTPYYTWVNLFFLVLAVLLYLPHLFWRLCEGGVVVRLTSKVNDSSVSEAERKAAIIEIAKYILITRGGHFLYTGAYVLSEAMNWLVGVLLTIWLVDFFKADMYFTSNEFNMESWDDFFAFNFPLMAKCVFNRYGTSGDVQRHDSLCFLPLNTLYGYMYLFLFAWFIMLCVLSALVIPYRIFGVLLPPIRLLLFRLRSGVKDQPLLDFLNAQLSFGDWFLLTRLQKNLLPHEITKLLIYVKQNFNKNPVDLEMDDVEKFN